MANTKRDEGGGNIKTLITGGLGMIGSELAKSLKKDTLIVIDNKSNNCIDESELECEFLEMGVEDVETIPKVDKIYHLASPIGVVKCVNNQVGAEIIKSTENIINIAKEYNARLLFASTSEIYDTNKTRGPRLEYSMAKELSEVMILNSGTDANIVRIFNCVSNKQRGDGGHVVPRFVQQAKGGEDITVFGDGNQTRCLSHVKDIVSGLIAIMKSDKSGEIFDVGNPYGEVSMMFLAELIRKECKSNSNIIKLDPKQLWCNYEEYHRGRKPNIKKLEALGWYPEWDLISIIKDVCSNV